MAKKNVIGEVYGRYTIIGNSENPNRIRRVIAQCSCGTVKEVILSSLRSGVTVSCGCYHKEIRTTHGLSKCKLYKIWNTMRDRCTNPNSQKYQDYGARGIAVCGEWQTSFENFKKWADVEYAPGLSLDRKDNDKGYSPENCRWATPVTQSRNQRARKKGTSKFTGVHWCNTTQKWGAMIGINGKKKNLGLFESELDAAKARDSFILQNNLTDFRMNNVL